MRDLLRDELVQRQPALQEELAEHREVPLGQAVSVPGRLQRAAAAEEVQQRHLQRHGRRRHPDQHHGAGQVAAVERLLPGLRPAHRVDRDVDAEAAGERLDLLDDVAVGDQHGVGGAELLGQLQLSGVGVDGDDGVRADQGRSGDGGVADAAAADDGDRVVPGDVPVLIAAPMPAITPQPSRPATSGGTAGLTLVHWPAATRVFSTNAPMPSAGDSTVPSARVIFCCGVVGGEAVPRAGRACRPGRTRRPRAS